MWLVDFLLGDWLDEPFLGGVGLLMMLLAGSKDGLVLLISGVAGGLSTLIFGYIIQLLFDCRRYLRRMTER